MIPDFTTWYRNKHTCYFLFNLYLFTVLHGIGHIFLHSELIPYIKSCCQNKIFSHLLTQRYRALSLPEDEDQDDYHKGHDQLPHLVVVAGEVGDCLLHSAGHLHLLLLISVWYSIRHLLPSLH